MVFQKADHRKSDRIKITHYVSPHEIWFKYDDSMEMEKMTEIQQTIQHFGDVKYFNYSPLEGDIVIVRCFGAVNKLIRGRVDFEYKYSKTSEYILWAIDEGYPIRCSKKRVMKLPSECLHLDNPFLFKCTLNKVLPATVKCDTLDFKKSIVKTKFWSEKAINLVANAISDAKSLIFHYDCHAAEQYLFGSIEVISDAGKSFTLDDLLKDSEEAVDCKSNFENEYKRLIHKNYWDQQNETYRIKEIGLDSFPQLDLNISAITMKEFNVTHNQRYRIAVEKFVCNTEPISSPSVTSSSENTFCTTSFCELSIRQSHANHQKPKTRPDFHFKRALDHKSFQKRSRTVLMHCSEGLLVQSISSIEQSKFSSEVCEELRSLGLTKINRTQAVGWPHLMRGHSLILVNSSKKEKSWTYLPAMCSLLAEAHTEHRILKSEGPVMIIICINSLEADRVLKDCQNFLKRNNLSETFSCKTAYGRNEDDDILAQLLNGMDILVTTIPRLLKLMKNPFLFNKERIMTIVFDGIDSMCNRFYVDNVDSIYKEFCADSRIQFIVTSRTWHVVLEAFCQKNGVLLCIGSYFEAAIYSGVEIGVHITDKDDHDHNVFSCIKNIDFSHEPTVIICNHSQDVDEVIDILRTEGIPTIFCYTKSDSLKMRAINNRFNQNQTDDLDVLICTDDVLLDLNVRRAQHLIHYSVPPDWTKFKHRFVACFEYCENLVHDRLGAGRPTSNIFADADNISKLPTKFQNLAVFY